MLEEIIVDNSGCKHGHHLLISSFIQYGIGQREWKGGLSLFQPATSFTFLEYMIVLCKIQEIINPLFFCHNIVQFVELRFYRGCHPCFFQAFTVTAPPPFISFIPSLSLFANHSFTLSYFNLNLNIKTFQKIIIFVSTYSGYFSVYHRFESQL